MNRLLRVAIMRDAMTNDFGPFPGAVAGHLLSEAKELLDSKGTTCAVMLLHRSALEAILSDHGLTQYHLVAKVKEFVSQNALFAAHEPRVLELKRRGDMVAHEGSVCSELRPADKDLIRADYSFLFGLYQALYSHKQAEYRHLLEAELTRRKKQARMS